MISTVTYNGDGATRIFPVAFEIKGEEYTVVYVGGVAVADRSLYDIINNSIVFNVAPVIGTNNVEIVVASTTTEIADLNAPPSTIQTVLDNIADINAIATTVIPNISDILLADDNAVIATTKALEALTSANNADTSEANALTYSNNALTSANNADISEANALSYKNSAEASATTATTQAGIATTKAVEASTSASQALGYRNEAEVFRDDAEAFAISIDPSNLLHKTGDTMTGNLIFASGTKIQGDFNNATTSSRTAFQNSILNANTSIEILPNGTGLASTIVLNTDSTTTNSSFLGFTANGTIGACTILAGFRGTGAYLPIAFQVGGAERLRIDTSGNVLVTGSGGLGYGTGSGGTVTQLTSKATAVTLNKPCGQITTHNASLEANAFAFFTVNNTSVLATDSIALSLKGGDATGASYCYGIQAVQANSFLIYFRNLTASARTDTLIFNFAVIKGVIS